MRNVRRYVKAAALALAGSLVVAQSALAQGGEEVGQNIGDLLGEWAQAIFVGLAAIVSLVLLLKRQYQEMAIFVIAAVVVGGFVFAPEAVAGSVEDIWKTVTA